jgi:hypothetical protein
MGGKHDLDAVMREVYAEIVPGVTVSKIRSNPVLSPLLKPAFVDEVTTASWLPFRCKPHHRCLIVFWSPPLLHEEGCIVCLRFEEECELSELHEYLVGSPGSHDFTVDHIAIYDPRRNRQIFPEQPTKSQ